MYLLISSRIHHLFLNLQTFQNVLDSSMIHKKLYVGALSVEGLQHAVNSLKKMAERQNLLSAVDWVKTLYKFPTSTVVTKTGFRIIMSIFFYRKEFRFRMFSYINAPLTLFLLGFWTDVTYWGGALLGPNNERLSKVVKTPQNAQNLISNNYLGI